VLLEELVDLLNPRPGQVAVDCTFGFGGHAAEVAARLGPTGLLVGIDRDPLAERRFGELNLPCRGRFLRAPFSAGLAQLLEEGLEADLVYFDLGLSSLQLEAERGFSYTQDGPLDMRMDPSQPLTAAEIVNTYPQRELADLLRRFGEERYASRIAQAIVTSRPLHRTGELASVVAAAIPAPARFGGGHPAKRTFQALRIAVNRELEELERALPLAWRLLRPGGRAAAISFHSLEDRAVKRFFAGLAKGCTCPPELPVCICGRKPEARILTKRAVVAGSAELERNPRAASAKLRAAEKVGGA
jgi:16S rRNA (cytosine1402-N4)-methyltransferase